MDQLGAYQSTTDPLLFTMHFLDGLKDHILLPVSLQRPPNWDTVCVLALLQEELLASRKSDVRKWDTSSGVRPFQRPTLPTTHRPPRYDKPGAAVEPRAPDPGRSLSADERWAALRSSRRAQGLCIKCGAKWSHDHRCSREVQLHALEEVLAIFSPDEVIDEMDIDSTPEPAEIQMRLFVAAVYGNSAPCTISFDGHLGSVPISVLLDSGSTHTFISSTIAARCSSLQPLYPPIQVKVANGQELLCDQYIPAAVWSIQGVEFQSDLKVLQLPSYDMILGMDWLSLHSPMRVHWAHQWLQIPYGVNTILLQGTLSSIPAGSTLQLRSIAMPDQASVPIWPIEI